MLFIQDCPFNWWHGRPDVAIVTQRVTVEGAWMKLLGTRRGPWERRRWEQRNLLFSFFLLPMRPRVSFVFLVFFVFLYFILRRLGTSQSLRQMCCPTSCAAKEACVITHVTYLGNSAPSPKLTKGDELTYYPGGTWHFFNLHNAFQDLKCY